MNKQQWFDEYWSHINKCNHWSVKKIIDTLPRHPSDDPEWTEEEFNLFKWGAIARAINRVIISENKFRRRK